MSKSLSTRREFITASSALAATSILPLHSHAADTDKLTLGIVGVGGRGGANLSGVSNEHVAVLCDTNPAALTAAAKRFPESRQESDWRKVVADPMLDGVVISTADHHHAPIAVAAMRNEKHVYVEKPLGHTVYEARLMQDEYKKRRGKIATQMGTQIHASGNYRRVVELIQSGAIGTVTEAHVWCNRGIKPVSPIVLPEQPTPEGFDWNTWLGPAADRPHNSGYWKGGNLNWNRRWEFGNGVVGDMGSHLIDLPYWALNLQYPSSVVSTGPTADPHAAPPWQVVTWEHAARPENPVFNSNLKLVWYHGSEGMKRREQLLQPLVGEATQIGKWSIGVAFIGSDGILVADYGKRVLSPVDKFKDFQAPAPSIPNSIGHHAEWLHAAKTGGESLCNFDYSGRLIENNLLGVVAHRSGSATPLQWDAENFSIPNNTAAEQYLTKTYRDGWKI